MSKEVQHREMQPKSPIEEMFDKYEKTRVEKDPLVALIELRGGLREYKEKDLSVPAKVDILQTRALKELERIDPNDTSKFDIKNGIGQQLKEYAAIIMTYHQDQQAKRLQIKGIKQEQKRFGKRK